MMNRLGMHSFEKGFISRLIFKTYLTKILWPNLGVGAGFNILDILQYVSGAKPDPTTPWTKFRFVDRFYIFTLWIFVATPCCMDLLRFQGNERFHPFYDTSMGRDKAPIGDMRQWLLDSLI